MTPQQRAARALVSIWGGRILVAAALLLPFGLSYPSSHNPSTEPRAAAWEALTTYYGLAYGLLTLALPLLLLGLLVVYQHTLHFPMPVVARQSLLLGAVLSVVGFGFLLAGIGERTAFIDYAQAYVLADPASLHAFDLAGFGHHTFGGAMAGSSLVAFAAGSLVGGLRQARVFPDWTIWPYVVGNLVLLLAGGFVFNGMFWGYGSTAQLLRVLGSLLLSISLLGWAWYIRHPVVVSAESSPNTRASSSPTTT